MTAGGSTNHGDAFTKAIELFDAASTNHKVIVMFTDGNTTTGVPPAPIAAAARAGDYHLLHRALSAPDGVDVSALNTWATPPAASHVAVTPDAAELEALFAELAANITKTGATNIVVNEIVNSDFVITSILNPNVGTATMLGPTSIRWNIAELGAPQSAALEFLLSATSRRRRAPKR